MGLIERVVGFFVKDSAERRRFVNEFNLNAKYFFQSLSVDTLLEAKMSIGNSDSSYRHELSAPTMVSGLTIEATAGAQISVDDIVMIGRISTCQEDVCPSLGHSNCKRFKNGKVC